MGNLEYQGATVAIDEDLVYKDYLDTLKLSDPTDSHIDSVVATELSSYATKAYVDSKDALLATRAYIDGQDNLRLKLAQKGAVNGIASLDATTKIPASLINAPLNQPWLRGPWSPAAYHASPVEAIDTTESALYTCGVTDPGYPYKLVVFGTQEVVTDTTGNYPTVLVRQGSAGGPIVAQGIGSGQYLGAVIDLFERVSSTGLGPDWTQSYTTNFWPGRIATPDGHSASLVVDGPSSIYANARYTKVGGATPSGDYLKITFTVASLGSGVGANDIWLDMNGRWQSDNSNYVLFRFVQGAVQAVYSVNGGPATILNGASSACSLQAGGTYDLYWGVTPSTPRRFQVYKNGSLAYDQTDTGNVTTLTTAARGWGFAMQCGGFGDTACTVGEIQMRDPLTSGTPTSEAVIGPVNLAALSTLTGPTTLYVRLLGTATGKVTASTFFPKLYVTAVPV